MPKLGGLVRAGHLVKFVDDESDVDFLVRVDLGETTSAGALNRAADVVNTILDVSIHNSGGDRPHLAQHAIMRSGRVNAYGRGKSRGRDGLHRRSVRRRDHRRAIEEHGLSIAEALAREELSRFVAAAVEAKTAADRPFSRDMSVRKPSEGDIRTVVPLADRVIQHVAAHAAVALHGFSISSASAG
jgi:hypothetical protein